MNDTVGKTHPGLAYSIDRTMAWSGLGTWPPTSDQWPVRGRPEISQDSQLRQRDVQVAANDTILLPAGRGDDHFLLAPVADGRRTCCHTRPWPSRRYSLSPSLIWLAPSRGLKLAGEREPIAAGRRSSGTWSGGAALGELVAADHTDAQHPWVRITPWMCSALARGDGGVT